MGLEIFLTEENKLRILSTSVVIEENLFDITPEILEELHQKIRDGVITNTTQLVYELNIISNFETWGIDKHSETFERCNENIDTEITNIRNNPNFKFLRGEK